MSRILRSDRPTLRAGATPRTAWVPPTPNTEAVHRWRAGDEATLDGLAADLAATATPAATRWAMYLRGARASRDAAGRGIAAWGVADPEASRRWREATAELAVCVNAARRVLGRT